MSKTYLYECESCKQIYGIFKDDDGNVIKQYLCRCQKIRAVKVAVICIGGTILLVGLAFYLGGLHG